MNWYSKTGRAGLIRDLMEKGLSARKAEKAVNAVVDLWTSALKRGENVELPVGWIWTKQYQGKQSKNSWRAVNVQTHKPMCKTRTQPGKRKVIKFIPNENRDWSDLPRPLSPELQKKGEEMESLFSHLTGRDASALNLPTLLDAVRDPSSLDTTEPQLFDRLLARLRELRKRGKTFLDLYDLAASLAMLFWIR